MTIDELLAQMASEPQGDVTMTEPVGQIADAIFAAFPSGSGVSFGIDGEVDPVRVTWWPTPEETG